MLRQMSSRNQRVKVFRLSHVLQICVLVVISVWLFYQTMHSHDKKALEEGTSKVEKSQFQILKPGRKDLPTTVQTTDSAAQIHLEGEDKEDAGELKQEKSDSGEEKETEEDMIDESDLDQTDKEAENGGREVADEKEKVDLAEESEPSDDQEQESSQEAREKTFKGDDASSAVAEGTKTAESESENGNPNNWDEKQSEILESEVTEAEITADGSKGNISSTGGPINGSKSNDADVFLKDNKSVSNNNSLPGNSTSMEERESKVMFPESEGSNFNSTSVKSNDQMELQANLIVNSSSSQKEFRMNSTAAFAPGIHMGNQGNATVVDIKTNNVTLYSESSIVGSVGDLNTTMETGSHVENTSNSQKSTTEHVQSSADRLEQPKESSSAALNEKRDTAQGESGYSSYSAVAKEEIGVHFDAPTLPNIRSKAKSNDREAALQ